MLVLLKVLGYDGRELMRVSTVEQLDAPRSIASVLVELLQTVTDHRVQPASLHVQQQAVNGLAEGTPSLADGAPPQRQERVQGVCVLVVLGSSWHVVVNGTTKIKTTLKPAREN